MHGLWKDVAEKEIVIIASFDHFPQVTNEMDLFLPPRFIFRKDAQNPLLFGTWNRGSFSSGGATGPLSWRSTVLNLCTVLPITNQ